MSMTEPSPAGLPGAMDLDHARAMARERFKDRLQRGEPVTGCECGDGDATPAPGEATRVIGVRFIDSGQVYYFDAGSHELNTGDWVVVDSSRGREAGKVVLAPHDIRMSRLKGDLKPIVRPMSVADVELMQVLRGQSAAAVRLFSEKIRQNRLPMKAISAGYNFDGTQLTLNYSSPDRVETRSLGRDLAASFSTEVVLNQVGPRDEARLLGGLGRCGRTLCCSSWLPVFPDISMAMLKTQDLAPNPSKVSGVCGRLLCCLSYENEQYRKTKSVMPKLAQPVDTPLGPGVVMSLQILKELVSVRLDMDGTVVAMAAVDLGYGSRKVIELQQPVRERAEQPPAPDRVEVLPSERPSVPVAAVDSATPSYDRKRRRRRRGGNQAGGQNQATE